MKKNALALVLSTLLDIIENQGGEQTTMKEDTLIVSQTDSKGATILNLKSPALEDYLDPEQVDLLREADLLLNDGEVEKKRFGRKNEFVLGVRLDALQRKVREAEADVSQATVLQRENQKLQRELKIARSESAADRAMAILMESIRAQYRRKSPTSPVKFERSKPSKKQALAGIPTLFLSDWHWGETVQPEQVEYLNEFNLDIASRRADRVFRKSLELLFHHQAGQHYDGMVFILGGDMFSGNIHEELRITNGAPINDCILSLAEKLTDNIVEASKHFQWIYVPGVVGNHGRIDRKPTAKNAVKDNYDWLLYNIVKQQVQGRLGDKCNVEFDISTSLDLQFKLYNTRYLLTHGDQIQGGAGVGGFWPSMMKTAHRKQERSVHMGLGGFDYMLCGHFHKYGTVSNVLVNGSLKGYDEWVYKMNFGYEEPIQALWVTHPELGIIDHRPVYAETPVTDAGLDVPPVIPSQGLLAQRMALGR